MRRALAISTAMLLAASLAACGDDATVKTTRLTFVSSQAKLQVDDVGRRGPSMGDTRTFSQVLVDPASGRPMGRLDGTTHITDEVGGGRAAREYRSGIVQFSLPGGIVVVGGVYKARPGEFTPAPEGVRRPIVGGTGAYRDAGGEVAQYPLSGNRIRNVLNIRTPADG